MKYTLEPWLVRWEQSIQRTLFSPEEKKRYFAKFNVEGAAPGRLCQQDDRLCYGKAERLDERQRHPGIENMDRIPAEEGGDLYLINGNMLPLGNAGALQIPKRAMTERRKTPMKKFWKGRTRQRRRQLRRNGRCS